MGPYNVGQTMTNPRHLSYDSLEAWAEGEKLPEDWTKHGDPQRRDQWWTEYAELKQHLWANHIESLSEEERKSFADGTHPSLRHEFRERALPYTGELARELARLGYSADVTLVFYHLDRIVLLAALDRTPPGGLRGVPWLFRGFEIKYRFPITVVEGAQPAR
jgi:hypothetical protein